MKFRTEIQVAPFEVKIGYQSRLLALGSCFAEHIPARLAQHKFLAAANPTGVLFNPLSVAAALHSFASPKPVTRDELQHHQGVWFNYGFHGSFSSPDPEQALAQMNAGRQAGAQMLREADFLLLTFGTAWVYERNGETVANCHRRPASEFLRRRLSVDQIIEAFEPLLRGSLAEKQIVVTVSPVRHLGEGFEDNSASKAVLRLAAEALAAANPSIRYFPAYEIMTDDLRDYRFYAEDMVHPSPQAIEYVWEKFSHAALDEQSVQLLPRVAGIVSAAAHRPLHPDSKAFRDFCQKQLREIATLPQVDFRTEEEYFRRCLEINS